jgi:hypothetical protein
MTIRRQTLTPGNLQKGCSLSLGMNATRLIALAAFFWGSAVAAAVVNWSTVKLVIVFVSLASTTSVWIIGIHIADRLRHTLVAELLSGDVRHIS